MSVYTQNFKNELRKAFDGFDRRHFLPGTGGEDEKFKGGPFTYLGTVLGATAGIITAVAGIAGLLCFTAGQIAAAGLVVAAGVVGGYSDAETAEKKFLNGLGKVLGMPLVCVGAVPLFACRAAGIGLDSLCRVGYAAVRARGKASTTETAENKAQIQARMSGETRTSSIAGHEPKLAQ